MNSIVMLYSQKRAILISEIILSVTSTYWFGCCHLAKISVKKVKSKQESFNFKKFEWLSASVTKKVLLVQLLEDHLFIPALKLLCWGYNKKKYHTVERSCSVAKPYYYFCHNIWINITNHEQIMIYLSLFFVISANTIIQIF